MTGSAAGQGMTGYAPAGEHLTGHAAAAGRAGTRPWPSLQSADFPRLLICAISLALVAAGLAGTAAHFVQVSIAVAFGLFIAFGELLRLPLPGNRAGAPIAMAGCLAYAMLTYMGIPQESARQSALQVVAVAALGIAIGALPHVVAGRPAALVAMCARLIPTACVAFLFRPLASDRYLTAPRHWPIDLGVMIVLIVVARLITIAVTALARSAEVGVPFGVSVWDEVRVQWPIALAVGAFVIMLVFGARVMGLLELAVMIGPLLVTHLAFRRYGGIRATYLQMVRSLGRVTEVGGYTPTGHSRRVSQVAVAVGRELGMSETDLVDLEYAALMHDIGRLSLRDPEAGAAVWPSGDDAERVAELGAEVVRETGLHWVAELVRCQAWPARGHNPPPPVGSRIIRATAVFDGIVAGSADRDRVAAALDWLRRGTPVEFDPGVVEALSEVAGRRLGSLLWVGD